jgi:flagellar biosynthesis anti-sigma factor FlgM
MQFHPTKTMRRTHTRTRTACSKALKRFLLGDLMAGNFMARLAGIPDLRQTRVEALRQAIQAGTYVISPDRIAEAMLASSDVIVRG